MVDEAMRKPPRNIDTEAETVYNSLRENLPRLSNEMELRLHIEPVIREALHALYGIDLEQIRSERTNEAGRFDTAYGGVVVEYEWQMGAARRRAGAQQALDYVAAERARLGGSEGVFSAIVTDGRQWGFLVSDAVLDPQLALYVDEPVDAAARFVWLPNSVAACRRLLELVGSHPKTPVSGATLSGAFGRGSDVARQGISILIEALANRDAGDAADTLYREWRRSLEVAYGSLDTQSTDDYGIRSEYGLLPRGTLGELIFSLHTYFALLSRLIALEVLAISTGDVEARPSTWSALGDKHLLHKLRQLEAGALPRDLAVPNLLEGDVFSWYVSRGEGNVTLLNSIRQICSTLSKFAFPRLAFGAAPSLDIFRDLYQRLTTRELRGALGEFLTPNWLAQATLEAAGRHSANLKSDRVLDCTCGTGTFLFPIVSARLRQLRSTSSASPPAAADVQRVLNSVVGIDINPVAVMAARMNYLIALGDLAAVGELYIPVWLADSILLPEEPPAQVDFRRSAELIGARFRELKTSLDLPFIVPVECMDQNLLARVSHHLRMTIERGASPNEFLESLENAIGPRSESPVPGGADGWSNTRKVLRVLYEQIASLHSEGRDGVWAEIIKNRFAPLLLGRFDLVVGNPPWLTYTKLPAEWRQAAQTTWRSYGLFETPPMPGVEEPVSFQSSDLAVLVTAVALDRYLKDGGLLAFVTPKALVSGDPANRAFRLYHLSSLRDELAWGRERATDVRFHIEEILDFSDVNPFSPDASNTPIVMVLRKGVSNRFPIPGSRWHRRQSRAVIPDTTWDRVSAGYLAHGAVRWVPVSTFPASPLAWWRPDEEAYQGEPSPYTYGKGFDTRGANGILFLELRGRVDSSGLIRVANRPELGRDSEVVARGPRTAMVEAELVVPVLRGRNIKPYCSEPSLFVLAAHDPEDRSRPLSAGQLAREYPAARRFLSSFKDKLITRRPYLSFKPDENLWWLLQGTTHMDEGYLVCISEIADPPSAAVLSATWSADLGRTVLPMPDHKATFFNTSDRDEAYFLAGLFNSRAMQLLIQRFANLTAVSPATVRHLPIPRYDPGSEIHRSIAQASSDAHAAVDEDERTRAGAKVDELVERLLRAGAPAEERATLQE